MANQILYWCRYTVKPRYTVAGKIANLLRHIELLLYWNFTFMQLSTVIDGFFLCGKGWKILRIIGQLEKANLKEKKNLFWWIWELAMKDKVFMRCRQYLHIDSTKWSLPRFCVHTASAADIVNHSGSTLSWKNSPKIIILPNAKFERNSMRVFISQYIGWHGQSVLCGTLQTEQCVPWLPR